MTDVATVSLGLAFLAGLVSFLSPCVVPLLPGYVSFATGLAAATLRGTSYLAMGGTSMGIAGSIVDQDFFHAPSVPISSLALRTSSTGSPGPTLKLPRRSRKALLEAVTRT